MTDKVLRIRGHHLLCILGFRGRGYDRRFVQNMGTLVSTIRQDPDLTFVLTDRCDDICSACPHNTAGRCRKKPQGEDVAQKADRAVLGRLGLAPGERHTARQVYKSVAAKVRPVHVGREFCTACQWRELGFCKEGLRALREQEFFTCTAG